MCIADSLPNQQKVSAAGGNMLVGTYTQGCTISSITFKSGTDVVSEFDLTKGNGNIYANVKQNENNYDIDTIYTAHFSDGTEDDFHIRQNARSGPTPPQPGEGLRGTFSKLIFYNNTSNEVLYTNGCGKMYITHSPTQTMTSPHYSIIFNLNGEYDFTHGVNCNKQGLSINAGSSKTFNNVPFEVKVGTDSVTLDDLVGCRFEEGSDGQTFDASASIWGAGRGESPLNKNAGAITTESGGEATFKDGGSYIISFSEIINGCYDGGRWCYDTSKIC